MSVVRSFRPPLWAWVLAILGIALFASLGTWQIQRGLAREARAGAYTESLVQTPQAFRGQAAIAHVPQRVVLSGEYRVELSLLLDNHAHQKQPGYQVWTPFDLDGGGRVLVNRGWRAWEGERRVPSLDAPLGAQTIEGLWQILPRAGMTAATVPCERLDVAQRIVNYPSIDDLRCRLGASLHDGQLLLDPKAPGGFVRDWQPDIGLPSTRHYGYAAQWYALALTALVLFVVLNLKRESV